MDILFTFPRKNPKYSNINELVKTCIFLDIPYKNTNKTQLINILNNYYKKYEYDLLPNRIQINFQNKYYYINTYITSYKSLIKTYDDIYREVYILTNYNGRFSYIVRYSKLERKWEMETNFKVQPDSEVELKIKEKELNRLRNISLYLELHHIFINLYLQDFIIKDIFMYIMNIYKEYCELPSKCYKIL